MSTISAADTASAAAAARSSPCTRCSAPVEPGDAFCPACGLPHDPTLPGAPSSSTGPAATVHEFRCENCGAEVRCDFDTRTVACPFCASPYVVDLPEAQTGRQEPEFVIGFAVTADSADRAYREWIGRGGLFRPGDLHARAEDDGLRGIYLPFWSFSLRADSRWSVRIGEHWMRTETYTFRDSEGKTQTGTRQVQETEWWPLQGRYHAYYSFYLVSGSKGLAQAISEWIQPFELAALKRYSPKFLAGWMSENYTVAKETAEALSREEFHRRQMQAIAGFLPGDTHQSLEVQTEFSRVNSDLILLPIYLRSYRYKGKVFRTLINGQSGKVAGERPISAARIWAAVALLAALVGVIILLARGFGR